MNAECPPIDILVCNAGIIERKPAAEHPDEYWDTVMEVNLNSPFILAREFGKQMLERATVKSFLPLRCFLSREASMYPATQPARAPSPVSPWPFPTNGPVKA